MSASGERYSAAASRTGFDRCGKELQVTTAPLADLATKQEAPPETQIMDHAEPQVAALPDIPFWSLLERALPNEAFQLPEDCAGHG